MKRYVLIYVRLSDFYLDSNTLAFFYYYFTFQKDMTNTLMPTKWKKESFCHCTAVGKERAIADCFASCVPIRTHSGRVVPSDFFKLSNNTI